MFAFALRDENVFCRSIWGFGSEDVEGGLWEEYELSRVMEGDVEVARFAQAFGIEEQDFIFEALKTGDPLWDSNSALVCFGLQRVDSDFSFFRRVLAHYYNLTLFLSYSSPIALF